MVLGHRIGNRERDHTEQHIVGINQYCYYSEKRHLQTYLKPIFGDSYFALLEGPVPSTSYDIIKVIRGEDNSFFKNIAKSVLNFEEIPLRYVKPFYVIGLREANIKLFSKSEIEIFDQVFEEYHKFKSTDLSKLSHNETAWKSAFSKCHNIMDFEEIIENKEAWDYIKSKEDELEDIRATIQLQ